MFKILQSNGEVYRETIIQQSTQKGIAMRKLYRINYAVSTDNTNYTNIYQTAIFYDEYKEPVIHHFTDYDSLRRYVEPRCLGYQETSIFTFKPYGLSLKGGIYIKKKAKDISIYYKLSYKEVEYVTMQELLEKLDSKEFIQYMKDNNITTINQNG